MSAQKCISSKAHVVSAGDRDYGNRREDDRSRPYSDRGTESEGQRRSGSSSSGNAWAKGKPSSLGGKQPIILKRKVDEETPVSVQYYLFVDVLLLCVVFQNFSQPSRFAGLADEQEEAAEKPKTETDVANES